MKSIENDHYMILFESSGPSTIFKRLDQPGSLETHNGAGRYSHHLAQVVEMLKEEPLHKRRDVGIFYVLK